MKNNLFAVILVLGACVAAHGQGVDFFHDPQWEKVCKTARKDQKILFVDCYTSWCGPCMSLTKKVFPQENVGDFYNRHFINVKYDMEKPAGKDFAQKTGIHVNAYPTLLFIDPNTGEVLHKFLGYKEPEAFIQEGKKALDGGGFSTLQKRYDAGERTLAFMQVYIRALYNAGQRESAAERLDDFLKDSLVLLQQKDYWQAFSDYIYGHLETSYTQYVIHHLSKFYKLPFVDKARLEKDIVKTLRTTLSTAFSIEEGRLKYHPELYELVRKNLESLPEVPIEERSRFYIYDQILAHHWENAYRAIDHACAFGFRYASNARLTLYRYIASQTDNRDLLTTLLAEYENLQKEEMKRMPLTNYYAHIAYIAQKLGLEEKAADARKSYEELQKAREKQFGKPKAHKKK